MKTLLLITLIVLVAKVNTQVGPSDNCLVFLGYCRECLPDYVMTGDNFCILPIPNCVIYDANNPPGCEVCNSVTVQSNGLCECDASKGYIKASYNQDVCLKKIPNCVSYGLDNKC
jgi:hypothetical protein